MNLPHFAGWHLIGAFPDGQPNDVGSWLLHHGDEALLLETPPGLTVRKVKTALAQTGCELKYVCASHDHMDHFDEDVWGALLAAFPDAEFIDPVFVRGDYLIYVGGEPCWRIWAPKHSETDTATIFRGVAMTGDIELGALESVNEEVPKATKRRSMARLRGFQDRTGYRVHTTISAHLNDVRVNVDWPALFTYSEMRHVALAGT